MCILAVLVNFLAAYLGSEYKTTHLWFLLIHTLTQGSPTVEVPDLGMPPGPERACSLISPPDLSEKHKYPHVPAKQSAPWGSTSILGNRHDE